MRLDLCLTGLPSVGHSPIWTPFTAADERGPRGAGQCAHLSSLHAEPERGGSEVAVGSDRKTTPLRDAHRPKRGGRTAGGRRERSGRDRGRRRRGREPRGRRGASEECDVVAVWTRAGAQDDVGLRRSERRVEARVFTRRVLRRHRRTGGNRAAAPFLTLPPRRAGRQRFGSVKSVSSNHTGCFLSNTPSRKSQGESSYSSR